MGLPKRDMTSLATTVAVVAALLLHTIVAQETHVVGDSLGWIVPPGGPIAYQTWASMQTFTVGDILVFNFITGEQDVARVTRESFEACNSTNPISIQTTGPANFTLDSAGEYYFIGTMDRRCYLGQRLAINVTASSSGPMPSPAPPPPPTPQVPAPPRAPVTYVVGDALGWLVPPGGKIAYATWAYGKTFFVGDTLVFEFRTGEQDVAMVSKEAFDTCNATNPIELRTTGPANFTLGSVGEYYFIGTMDRRCSLGQKLAITVTNSSAPPPHHVPGAPPRSGPITYVVGDGLGWLVPPGGSIAYATWAYHKTFLVGDTLVFNFVNGTQDVALVARSAYETCDINNTISVLTTSPARITLTTTGEHFFTCTYPRHCAYGQRLVINVTGDTSATAPSSYGPTAGGPNPPLSSSASSHAVATFYVTILFIATAFSFNK